jgi:hypothetical protein
MLLPLLILQLGQAASPSSMVVVVTRRTAVSNNDAQTFAGAVTRSLKEAGLELAWEADAAARRLASLGVKDTSVCAGRMGCVQEFGRQLEASVVVGVSMSQVDKDRSVSLEAVRVSDGVLLGRENLLYASSAQPPLEQLKAFAGRIRAALAPPLVVDVPRQAPVLELRAAPLASAPAPVLEAPVQRSHTAAWLTGGGAVVAVAAAVTLGVLAFSSRAELSRGARLPDGRIGSTLTGQEALAVSRRANGEFLGAAICAGTGLGLGTTAVVLW